MQKCEVRPIPYTKIDSQWVKDLDFWLNIVNILNNNVGETARSKHRPTRIGKTHNHAIVFTLMKQYLYFYEVFTNVFYVFYFSKLKIRSFFKFESHCFVTSRKNKWEGNWVFICFNICLLVRLIFHSNLSSEILLFGLFYYSLLSWGHWIQFSSRMSQRFIIYTLISCLKKNLSFYI